MYLVHTTLFRSGYDERNGKFFGWNLLNTMIVIISIQGQSVLLNHFFGTLLNAAQGITTQLNGQLQALSSGMTKALNPVIGKSAGA